MRSCTLFVTALLCALAAGAAAVPRLPLRPVTNAATQTRAAIELFQRVLPDHAHLFDVVVDSTRAAGFDLLDGPNGRLRVTGSTGVDAASGLHWYIKYHLNASVSWERTGGNSLNNLPAALPSVGRVSVNRTVPWTYYQNVCTVSYSMAWWNISRWTDEITWMALQGVNMPLAFTGQEAVWQSVYRKLGMSDAAIRRYLGGPAFMAWSRMGNIQGWGGDMPQSWIDGQAELQVQILERMRALGMVPVLPGFAGHVPAELAAKFPNASITRLDGWSGFQCDYSCTAFLDPSDPLFRSIGAMFVRELVRLFGTDHIYNSDSFNEMAPPTSDPDYLRAVGRGTLAAMTDADPDAVWLMQGWLFRDDFWGNVQVQALLSGVPDDRMLILDLNSDTHPQWQRTQSFFGKPYVWCMLHNYGGNIGMYGDLHTLATAPYEALAANGSSMVAVGLTPEGIDQNVIVYELVLEAAFRPAPVNASAWVQRYAQRRYGGLACPAAGAAWALLERSVYNCTDKHDDHTMDIPTSRPGRNASEAGLFALQPHMWYDQRDVRDALRLLLSCAAVDARFASSQPYLYDVVDVARQMMSKVSTGMYEDLMASYYARDVPAIRAHGSQLLQLLSDLDELLNSHFGFLLGPWLHDARRWGGDDQATADLLEWNARTQISIWGGPDFSAYVLNDYANKEWAGLMGGYYHDRWQVFVDALVADVQGTVAYDPDAFLQLMIQYSQRWSNQTVRTDDYPLQPRGDALAIAGRMLRKYGPLVQK